MLHSPVLLLKVLQTATRDQHHEINKALAKITFYIRSFFHSSKSFISTSCSCGSLFLREIPSKA
ncbi:hypothetical protein E2C01_003922 [Portunus trituberculatus]|uniref:Uncharacterized protein n=1 Tax=Portunus trituberculatus TaxID=210409 RepID=A0A5B7CP53_PORTR|nr:hypothetical protein [Portunus trituberculatus]